MNRQIYINLYLYISVFYHVYTYFILLCFSSINNVELSSDVKVVNDIRDGLFDVKIISRVPQTALKSETIINCQLVIPNTNYTKKRETVYYGKTGY